MLNHVTVSPINKSGFLEKLNLRDLTVTYLYRKTNIEAKDHLERNRRYSD